MTSFAIMELVTTMPQPKPSKRHTIRITHDISSWELASMALFYLMGDFGDWAHHEGNNKTKLVQYVRDTEPKLLMEYARSYLARYGDDTPTGTLNELHSFETDEMSYDDYAKVDEQVTGIICKKLESLVKNRKKR